MRSHGFHRSVSMIFYQPILYLHWTLSPHCLFRLYYFMMKHMHSTARLTLSTYCIFNTLNATLITYRPSIQDTNANFLLRDPCYIILKCSRHRRSWYIYSSYVFLLLLALAVTSVNVLKLMHKSCKIGRSRSYFGNAYTCGPDFILFFNLEKLWAFETAHFKSCSLNILFLW